MVTWPTPKDEADRLYQIGRYQLLGPEPEPLFDAIAQIAASTCNTPFGFVSIIGESDQWLKGKWGSDLSSTPRASSFCAHTIAARGVFVVDDACEDDRFNGNPLVTGELGIRYYAGVPLINGAGVALGALCVLDVRKRPDIGEWHLRQLQCLTHLIGDLCEHRRSLNIHNAVSGFTGCSGMAIVTTTATGAITFWNTAAEQMFGYCFAEAEGRDISLIIPPRFRSDHHNGLARINAGGEPRMKGKAVEVVGLHRDGHEFPIEISLTAWEGEQGWEFGAQIQDISVRHARDLKLRHLAVHDPLTGLPNRREFLERLTQVLAKDQSAAVLMLDLDGFKSVNDTLGHLTGDDLLRLVTVRMAARLPTGSMLARMGGDEFAILLPDCGDPTQAYEIARRLLAAFEDDFSVGSHELRLSASVGFALAPVHAIDTDELLLRADLALLEAKRREGGFIRIFDRGLENRLVEQRLFKEEVRRATLSQEWELYYQPQLTLADNRLVGMEALLRWRHPSRGLITPDVFLETLEKHSVATEVGKWIANKSCAELVRIRQAGIPLPSISINLFAIQLRSAGIERFVLELLERNSLAPSDLELELTEKVVIQQDTQSLQELRGLRHAGVRLAFDDFGTGFASFATLKDFPVDKLKIDKSFVADITHCPHSRAIVRGVAHLAADLGITLVAEGVETTAQRDALIDLGCKIGQGFLWGRPSPDMQDFISRIDAVPSAHCFREDAMAKLNSLRALK